MSTIAMVVIVGCAVVVTAVLTTALISLVANRVLSARLGAVGDEVATKVRGAVTQAIEEALPELRDQVEGGVSDGARATLPRLRDEVREGVSEALASAVTGGLLGRAGEELVKKGGSVLDILLGGRADPDGREQ